MDILHPRIEIDGEKKCFPVCASPIGRLTKFKNKDSEEIFFEETFGVGIMVYFRLLKAFACMFLMFTLVSLPPLIMYAAGTDDADGTFNSKNTFSQFSLGNLGGSSKTCAVGDVGATGELGEATLLCQFGTFTNFLAFARTDETCGSEAQVKYDRNCNLSENEFFKQKSAHCLGRSLCTLTVSDFDSVYDDLPE